MCFIDVIKLRMLGLWRFKDTFNDIYVTLWRSDVLATEHRASGTSLKISNQSSDAVPQ